MSKTTGDASVQKAGRQPYRKPVLRTYGNVSQITQAGSSSGGDDNAKGKGSGNKTGVGAAKGG